MLNFARHVKRNHSLETEVVKAFMYPPKSASRKKALELLRKKGNYLMSNVTCKPVKKPLLKGKMLPCDNCFGYYSVKLLGRHRNKCTGSKKRSHAASAQNMLLSGLDVDPQLRHNVFPRMRADDISIVAKKDVLICAYGARYIKIHREHHHVNVASRKMRELAKLLMELRKFEPSIKTLFDALQPKYFDIMVNATKVIANYNAEKRIYESHTIALNMGTTIKQCAELAILFPLKRKNISQSLVAAEVEADLRTLIQIVQSQWKYEISIHAANDINVNKRNKVTLVSLAGDLKRLKEFLTTTANTAIAELKKDGTCKEQYVTLQETIYCRVMLLNRR